MLYYTDFLPNTSPGELREQDHALDVVILEQVDVGSHVSDGPDVDHHNVVYLGKLLLVKST